MKIIHFKTLRYSGFTLLEIMTTLLILSVLLFALLPLGQSFFSKNVLEKTTHSIVNAVKFARNKAQLDGVELILSESSKKNGWLDGMSLYTAKNYQKQTGEKIIRKWHWNEKLIKVEWHGFISKHYLLFSSKLKSSALSGYFLLSSKDQLKTKIIINRLGRVRIEKVS